MTKQKLRVAAFQRRPLYDDIAGTVERLAEDLKWCDERCVDLAVFPECYLQGYASDRQVIARRALSLKEETVTRIMSGFASYRVTTILGLIEERTTGFYNTAIVIRKGIILGAYSKTHPNEKGFDAGSDYPIFKACFWSFGINICNDANFPDAALQISRQGARLLFFPLNNMLSPANASLWRNKSIENLQKRAIETGCWVVSSDVVGKQGEKISYGCTCIVRPDGEIVKRASEGIEDAITFDLATDSFGSKPALLL